MLELILEHVDDVQGFVDREEFVKPIPLGHAEVLLVTEQEVAAALDVTTSGLGLLLRLVKPHSVDDLTTVPGDDMEAVVDEGRVRTHLLQGVAVGTRHVEREGLDRSELVVRELTEEALDGLLAPVLTHPDEAPGFEVEDRGHVAVALADTNLVDRQEPEPIVARGADFAEQAPLVYLLDGVPGQAEVLGHLFDGQIPTQVLDSLLEAARRSSWATATTMPCPSHFSRTLECELIDRYRFKTQAEARMAVFGFIEGWYNPRRRHSSLGYESPISFEDNHANRSDACPAAAGTATFNEPGMLLLPCASGAAEASDSKGSWEKRENTST